MPADPPRSTTGWTVVLPVQHAERGKSRLVAPDGVRRPDLARAIALDALAAVRACPVVEAVVLVTSDPVLAGTPAPVRVVPDPGAGLTAAVAAGLSASPAAPVAVLLADVPALLPADLSAALAEASGVASAVVPDCAGTGTVLLTGRRPALVRHAFGEDSASRHVELGAARLDLPLPRLRQDVDTLEDLRSAAALGLGSATSALLGPDWH